MYNIKGILKTTILAVLLFISAAMIPTTLQGQSLKETVKTVKSLETQNAELAATVAAVQAELKEVKANAPKLPDTLFFQFDGKQVTIPAVEYHQLVSQGSDLYAEIKRRAGEDKPSGPLGWLMLLIPVLATAPGITFITNLAKTGKKAVVFVSSFKTAPENLAILLAVVGGILLTFIFNKWQWSDDSFQKFTPWLFTIATFIYLKTKKKEATNNA